MEIAWNGLMNQIMKLNVSVTLNTGPPSHVAVIGCAVK